MKDKKKVEAWKRRREPTIKKYLLNRVYVNKRGCWIWKNSKGKRGGTAEYAGKSEIASRASYKAFKGPIPKSKLIRHTCDDARCINPKHLIPGTYKDNKRDYMERHPRAKILLKRFQKLGNEANRGRKQSKEERAMRSAMFMGNKNGCGNKGKPKSKSHCLNISLGQLKYQRKKRREHARLHPGL